MPESPDIKVSSAFHSSHSPKTCTMTGVPPLPPATSRPLSSNSSVSGLNGSHSPQSTTVMNGGRTPSPPTLGSLMNSSSGQQLPPACGARQLSKLKRFLTTLQQFGSDISPEIGERVRTLVLGLVNSHLSIEEFHGKLQEATNFPLRPFVIPFLKANLPLLQRELHHCARIAKQSPQQFLTQNEQILFDPTHSPLDARDNPMADLNENGKRRSPDSRPKENGLDLHIDAPPHPAKRHHGSHPVSPVSLSRTSPGSTFNLSAGGPIRLEDISKSRELREREARERLEREQVDRARERERERDRDRERHFSNYSFRSSESYEHLERLDDDWRHVETMLNCIIGMVDKTKRAMSVLQERSMRDREESLWARRQADVVGIEAADVKKRSGDVMAYTIRQRAEEAVNDVKRQAMVELQKALSAADQKAAELVSAERAKMERAISETRKQTQTELLRSLNHQEESAESCWNCGRKASETCSGCNVARYCGSFCQHKDWENHHHVCGKAHITSAADARELRRAAAVAAAAAAAVASSTSSGPSSSSPLVTVAAASSLATCSSILSPSSTATTATAGAPGAAGVCKTSNDGRDQSPSFSAPSSSKSPLPSSSASSKTSGREVNSISCSSPAPLAVPSLSGRNSPVKTADSPSSSPGRTLSPVPSEPASPNPGDTA
ncbi:protein CBFA2T1 [Elysia marginata]|uniref:Protein CBFA2T1 n=1 Tax=Elysia marginata TaxID=1093978 RepID=A0AAV4EDS8_9GAST|nr:protein CBFA2T1 [Elysia marginata]